MQFVADFARRGVNESFLPRDLPRLLLFRLPRGPGRGVEIKIQRRFIWK